MIPLFLATTPITRITCVYGALAPAMNLTSTNSIKATTSVLLVSVNLLSTLQVASTLMTLVSRVRSSDWSSSIFSVLLRCMTSSADSKSLILTGLSSPNSTKFNLTIPTPPSAPSNSSEFWLTRRSFLTSRHGTSSTTPSLTPTILFFLRPLRSGLAA